MATISRLVPGQIVYSVELRRMGNTLLREQSIFEVRICEVHEDYVIASWNGNKPGKYWKHSIATWRVKKPQRKPNIFDLAREAARSQRENGAAK